MRIDVTADEWMALARACAEGRDSLVALWADGTREGRYTATIFPGPKDNFVFNAATIFWSQGLSTPPGHILPWSHWSRPLGPDSRVEQITHNLLRRATGQQ